LVEFITAPKRLRDQRSLDVLDALCSWKDLGCPRWPRRSPYEDQEVLEKIAVVVLYYPDTLLEVGGLGAPANLQRLPSI
jgi:hypothetical protein